MSLIGFKRLTIGVHDKLTGKITETHVIEGKENEGGTVSASISGLSAEAIKVYASNIAYHVLQKGTGDVSVDFGILDMKSTVNDAILGYKIDALNSFAFIGEDTEPPYCSIILESDTLSGDKALLGLFKGKFTREDYELETKEEGNVEPKPASYTFNAMASDREDVTKGQTVGKYIGSTKVEEFKLLVIPAPTV